MSADHDVSAAPQPRSAHARTAPKARPKYYDLNLAHLPPPGLVSIFHRVSGLLLFFPLLPAALYVFDATLASASAYAQWRDFFARPPVKVALLGVVWLYAHHFWAGLRYLLLDLHLLIDKAPARTSALAVLALGLLTTAVAGWWIW